MALQTNLVQHQNDNELKPKIKTKTHNTYFRFFRYTLIKMLKSPSTYVILVIMFAINLIEIISIGFAAKDNSSGIGTFIAVYSWSLYIIYFAISAMYIGFKSSQVIRDEIDDGTLLIFSSLPVSRFRLIIEKWFALQLVCLFYAFIVFFIPPLIGLSINSNFATTVFHSAGYFFLTGIIIQLILSTIGVLFSLIIGAKGVIGLTTLFGILSIIGAIIPMTYNIVNQNASSMYLQANVVNYVNFSQTIKKTNISNNTLNDIEDVFGWNYWKDDGTTNPNYIFDDPSQHWLAGQDQFIPIKMESDYVPPIKSSFPVITLTNFQFTLLKGPNTNTTKGVNIFQNFINSTHNSGYIVHPQISFSGKYNLDPNQIKWASTPNKQSEELLQLMKTLYSKKLYLNNNNILFGEYFDPRTFTPGETPFQWMRGQPVYFCDDQNNIDVALTLAIQTALMFNTVVYQLAQESMFLKPADYYHQILIYRVMSYLNIWQQWVLMWNGPSYPKSFGTDNNLSDVFFKPVNYYTDLTKVSPIDNPSQTFNVGQISHYHAISNVIVLYLVYVVIAIVLGAVTIFAVYRKDFV